MRGGCRKGQRAPVLPAAHGPQTSSSKGENAALQRPSATPGGKTPPCLHKVGMHVLHGSPTLRARRRSPAKQLGALHPALIPRSLLGASGTTRRRTELGGGCKFAAQFAGGLRTARMRRCCCHTEQSGGSGGVAWHSTQVLPVSHMSQHLAEKGRGGGRVGGGQLTPPQMEKSSTLGARQRKKKPLQDVEGKEL